MEKTSKHPSFGFGRTMGQVAVLSGGSLSLLWNLPQLPHGKEIVLWRRAVLSAELICREPIGSEQALGVSKVKFLEGLKAHEKRRLKDGR